MYIYIEEYLCIYEEFGYMADNVCIYMNACDLIFTISPKAGMGNLLASENDSCDCQFCIGLWD